MSHKKPNRGNTRKPQFARYRDKRRRTNEERKEAFVLILHPALWQFDNTEGAA